MNETDFKTLCGLFLSIMVCFGVMGNIISFVTWRKGKRCKHLPGAIYLSALAVSDNLILLTSGVKYCIELLFAINLWNLSTVACKLLHTTWHLFFLISTWIVVSLTLQRTIAVCRKLKRAAPSEKREMAVVLFFFVVFLLINLPFTFGAKMMVGDVGTQTRADLTMYMNKSLDLPLNLTRGEHHTYWGRGNNTGVTAEMTCQADPSSFYFKYETQYHNWFIDFGLLFVAPVTILIVCNVILLVKICRRNSALDGIDCQQYGKSSRTVSGPLTARVIALSVVQCISVGPFSVLALIPGMLPDAQAVDTVQFVNRLFIGLALVWYLNNSVNFVLYSLFGKAFREDCIDVICGYEKPSHPTSSSSLASSSAVARHSELSLTESVSNKKY